LYLASFIRVAWLGGTGLHVRRECPRNKKIKNEVHIVTPPICQIIYLRHNKYRKYNT
jgi:hypothetical protein